MLLSILAQMKKIAKRQKNKLRKLLVVVVKEIDRAMNLVDNNGVGAT